MNSVWQALGGNVTQSRRYQTDRSAGAQHGLFAYIAARAAIIHMTKSIALHRVLRHFAIRRNVFLPDVISAPASTKVLAQLDSPDTAKESWVAGHPIGRHRKPAEIATIAVCLASDGSAVTTGAVFRIDGGSSP